MSEEPNYQDPEYQRGVEEAGKSGSTILVKNINWDSSDWSAKNHRAWLWEDGYIYKIADEPKEELGTDKPVPVGEFTIAQAFEMGHSAGVADKMAKGFRLTSDKGCAFLYFEDYHIGLLNKELADKIRRFLSEARD